MTGTIEFAEMLDMTACPKGGTIADYYDHLVDQCAIQGGSMSWEHGRWVCRMPGPDGGMAEAVVPLKKCYLRELLARLAFRCAASPGGSFQPYGGEGRFQVGSDPAAVYRAEWVNTPAEQRLEMQRAG